MRSTRIWSSRKVDVVNYIRKLMSRFDLYHSDLVPSTSSLSDDIDWSTHDECEDNPPDEDFHGDYSIVQAKDLKDILTDEEKVGKWSQCQPCCANV